MSENYIPLALKYRPRKFEDMLGQEIASKTLRNSVINGTIYPSLVFYGHWGSGKTTSARIYGMALNCDNPQNGDPCGECESCKAIMRGEHPAYIEKDAASSGNVETVREIIDMLTYKPAGKCRVIVLDEAHACTNAAWQALLKSVEAPPPNNVFIFVTTEVDKIPDTISSRCFPIPFRSITQQDVVRRLAEICVNEGMKISSRLILPNIVRRSKGSVRNAIVALDQARAISMGTDNPGLITDEVMKTLGYADESIFVDFIRKMNAQPEEALKVFNFWSTQIGPEKFLDGLEEALYNEILLKTGAADEVQTRDLDIGISLPEVYQTTLRLWKVKDLAKNDISRIPVAFRCEILGIEPVAFHNVAQKKKEEPKVPVVEEQATEEDLTNMFA